MTAPAGLHPDLASLSVLLGDWAGEGHGVYPTIEPFDYAEEIRFWHVGKPFLAYSQRTWGLDDGRPLHGESGYWRPRPDGGVEVVIAHPSGVVEVSEGSIQPGPASREVVIDLRSTAVALTTSAKSVTALSRHLQVRPDVIEYRLDMAAVGHELQPHLFADLRRTA
jgi:hypothetical protein